jgi:hypothetical protein
VFCLAAIKLMPIEMDADFAQFSTNANVSNRESQNQNLNLGKQRNKDMANMEETGMGFQSQNSEYSHGARQR